MTTESDRPPASPSIVLDTNAVLDAWLFKDAGMVVVLQALIARRLVWVASPSMRDELVHTLALPSLLAWQSEASNALAGFDSHARLTEEPARTAHRQLWCTDNDDQVFMDLALVQGARWLLTKDRALLKLGRHAKRFGVQIQQPARWHGATGVDAPSAG